VNKKGGSGHLFSLAACRFFTHPPTTGMAESRITLFAEVILPLALPRTLTYRVPFEWNTRVTPGIRVIVPLGKSRLYTGIIRSIGQTAPRGYEAKYVEGLLDDAPVVTESQVHFWEWIAEYYCCTIGEVMNAALPGGLKLSSETKFTLSGEDWEEDGTLSERERQILTALKEKACTVHEIGEIIGIRTVQPILKGLVEKEYVYSEEEVRERFRPKREEIYSLHESVSGDAALQQVFSSLEKSRSSKQSDTLLAFLGLSGYDRGESRAVTRKELSAHRAVSTASVKALCEKNILRQELRDPHRIPVANTTPDLPPLAAEQDRAYREIIASLEQHPVALLHGITSSGKTEIYCHLIRDTLREGKQVLFLLPEIALTTQLITRLRRYFGALVKVYHSGFSDNQRSDTWMSMVQAPVTQPLIVLGARSSLFLPFTNPGLVIVDEEHEQSFKQHDPAPRYHARDAAVVWAKRHHAHVVLGSATPSLESYRNAVQDRYGLVELHERFGGISLPEIEIADIRKDLKKKTLSGNFTSPLVQAMKDALAENEQVILFQNRRGYSPLWQCNTCGWVPMCARCDVSMTYHKQSHLLKCHYCGYSASPPELCGACGHHDLRMLGFGTEKIEEEVKELFPEVCVKRMDLDTTRSRSSYQRIISEFEAGEIQVLVGTQMVTKGLDFDRVSVVGILNADRMMNFPDFRAMERSFQLMMQVAGRAGRRQKQGKVIIQTYAPDHWLLDLIGKGEYKTLYDREIRERHQFSYPPFVRMIRLTVKHREDHVAGEASELLVRRITQLNPGQVLGPEKPYVPRINNYFLRQILIKLHRTPDLAQTKARITEVCRELQQTDPYKSVRLTIDVDPV
jgi:primosomal protein N' (replication factor Y) (superfamily II helicase)